MTEKTEAQKFEIVMATINSDRNERKSQKKVNILCAIICVTCVAVFSIFCFTLKSVIVDMVSESLKNAVITYEENTETTTQSGEGDSVQFNNVQGDQNVQEGGGE